MADLNYGFAATGVDEVSRALSSVATQLGRINDRQTQNAQSGRQMARAGGEAKSEFEKLTNQGHQLTQKIQGTSAAVQSLVGQLGGQSRSAGLVASVAGNVAQFSSLGSMLGPGGTVVGAIVGLGAALVGLVRQQNDVATATAEASEALRDQAAAAAEARESVTATANLAAASSRRDLAPTLLADRSGSDLASEANTRRAGIVELERLTSENEILRSRVEGGGLTSANARNLTGGTEAMAALGGARSLDDARASLETLEREIERRRELEGAERSEAETRTRTEADRRRAAEEARAAEEEWLGEVRDRAAYEEAQRARAIAGAAERAEAMEAAWGREAAAIDQVRERELELIRIRGAEDVKAADEAASAEAEAFAEATKAAEDLIAKQIEVAQLNEELRHTADNLAVAFGDGVVSSLEAVADAWREANRAAAAAGTGMISTGSLLERSLVAVGNNIADVVGGTMLGAFEKSLGAWLDGTKTFVEAAEDMVKGVLKSLVIESIVQAVAEGARGIADIASYQYATGAQHFAAAAAWAAVGVAAGAVGAGIGAFGGGGGGGAQQAPTSRELAGAQQSERGGDTYNISVFPGGFITQDQVSGGIVDGLNRAARNGRRVDSRLLGR